jgi:tetratricopeptide (TPR) repeat protein
MRLLTAALTVIAAAAVWTPVPEARQPPAAARVLVMPFAVHTDATAPSAAFATSWLGEAASTLLADELTAQGYGALPREDRVDVFDRLSLPMSPELTRATMIRVAELIGASEVVFGEVRLGSELTVRARAIRLDTGRSLPEVTDRAALADIFTLFGRVARQIGRETGRPGRARPVPVAPMPLPALENYIKGLMAGTPAAQQRFLESAMTQTPRDGRVLTALWSVYADQGLHDKALSVASAVPADAPQLRRARFAVALSLIELKRFDGAIRELATLHAQQRAAAISNALGVTELRRGPAPAAAERAAPYFERAANEGRSDPDYLFNLGYARALAGDSAGALAWLRESVRHDAADGDAHLVMSAMLSLTGRTAEAQRELELARLLGTSLETVPAPLTRVPASLERIRTRLDDAVLASPALASPAQRDQRETARFHLDRGRTLVKEERDREAAVELQRSIYLAPYEDEPHLLLGGLYERTGRLAEAIDEFKVALWCRETAAARLALGRAFFSSGDRESARRELERALVLAPNSAEAREWLARIGG